MTSPMADLDRIERELRELCSPDAEWMPDGVRLTAFINAGREAADALAQLRRERDELRGALEAKGAVQTLVRAKGVLESLNKRIARATRDKEPGK